MSGKECATLEDALADALQWDRVENADGDMELSEADFGKYADGSGFYWTIRYRKTVKNSEPDPSYQDERSRIALIVKAYAEDRDRIALQELVQE